MLGRLLVKTGMYRQTTYTVKSVGVLATLEMQSCHPTAVFARKPWFKLKIQFLMAVPFVLLQVLV